MRSKPSIRRVCHLAVLLLFALATSAHAVYFKDGNELLERVHTDKAQAARFYAYVSAIVDALDGKGTPEIGCFRIPSQATLGQVADSVKMHLEGNPATRHKNAAHLVIGALSADYPCR